MKQEFRMIDVGEKEITRRRAIASGEITVSPKTMEMIKLGNSPKGNILAIAEVAGIMAAKTTSQIIPLCHPLLLDSTRIWFDLQNYTVTAKCEVICHGKTGVEMEALFGLNASLLTIYDLAKAVDPIIEISNVRLELKEGGKSGKWEHPKTKKIEKTQKIELSGIKAGVITLSDRASHGIYNDESGPILMNFLQESSVAEISYDVIPDEKKALQDLILKAKEQLIDLVVVTGGTGISERDITPEAITEIADKELIGFGELQRQYGAHFTKASWLSRSTAFIVGKTLVVLFPGSPKAVKQGLECLGELIPHALKMLKGEPHHKEESKVTK